MERIRVYRINYNVRLTQWPDKVKIMVELGKRMLENGYTFCSVRSGGEDDSHYDKGYRAHDTDFEHFSNTFMECYMEALEEAGDSYSVNFDYLWGHFVKGNVCFSVLVKYGNLMIDWYCREERAQMDDEGTVLGWVKDLCGEISSVTRKREEWPWYESWNELYNLPPWHKA